MLDDNPRSDEVRVGLKEAGAMLGLSANGVRARFKKGEIRGHIDNTGKIFVFISPVKAEQERLSKKGSGKPSRDENTAFNEPSVKGEEGRALTLLEAEIERKNKEIEAFKAEIEGYRTEQEELKAQITLIPFKDAEISGLKEKIELRDEQITSGKKRIEELMESRNEFRRYAIRARLEKQEIAKQSRAGWGVAAAATVLFILLTGFTVYSGYIAPQKAVSGFAAMSPASGP